MHTKSDKDKASWVPDVDRSEGPVYLAIADALGRDILSGKLAEGTCLPTQRQLANALGITFTTVTRAYAEGRRRGLIEGRVGQGTYVRRQSSGSAAPASTDFVDMAMNQPPWFEDASLAERMSASLEDVGSDLNLLMRYHVPGGRDEDKAAGAAWMESRLSVDARRVLVCPGTQGALFAIVGHLAEAGDVICTEELTYPGFRAVAARQKVRLEGIPMDREGLIPEAFEERCRRLKPKALYCVPTLHNPTTATMSAPRREAVAAIARKFSVPIIEDDVYGKLPMDAPPPLADVAPELTYYVAGVAKCLSPTLRVAYLVPPDNRSLARLRGEVRAVAAMNSPLTTALATQWIQSGLADAITAAIRKESVRRQIIAKETLPLEYVTADPEGFHLWLNLPEGWTRSALAERLRHSGVGVVTSDAFAVGVPPEAVRLSLGVPKTQIDLRKRLQIVADVFMEQPSFSSTVV